MTPIDLFFRAALRHPDRVALDAPGRQRRFADLADEVRALAAGLQALDPQVGSRVALIAANTPEHVTAWLAILAAGKVWVPISYRTAGPEVARILQAVAPSLVLVDAVGLGLLDSASVDSASVDSASVDGASAAGASSAGEGGWPPARPPIRIDDPTARQALIAAAGGRALVRHRLDRDATQAIKFTGGTTGLPKGVMQPVRAWNAGIVNQIAGWGLTADDRYVVAAPVTHGTSTYLLPVLAQGGCHLFLDESNPATITEAFRERGGTLSFMPPTLIYMLMAQPGVSRRDFPALRNLIYGGAPMPVDKIAEVQAFFGPVLGTTYGQTEAPQIVTMMRPAELAEPEHRGSVGRVTWFSEIAILDRDGQPLAAGETGEVAVRGDLVMTGYWRLPDKTAETLHDGWLRTGDVGLVDEAGYLSLKDRLRDVVISGGFNVYPIDVENVLSRHPAVYEASVFGVPDEKWGEAVHAAIQFHPGESATEADLRALVRASLGPVQTPKCIHAVASLPRSPVGKVLKSRLRDDVAAGRLASPRPA